MVLLYFIGDKWTRISFSFLSKWKPSVGRKKERAAEREWKKEWRFLWFPHLWLLSQPKIWSTANKRKHIARQSKSDMKFLLCTHKHTLTQPPTHTHYTRHTKGSNSFWLIRLTMRIHTLSTDKERERKRVSVYMHALSFQSGHPLLPFTAIVCTNFFDIPTTNGSFVEHTFYVINANLARFYSFSICFTPVSSFGN